MSATFDRAVFRMRANGASTAAQLRTFYWRLLGMQVGARTLLQPLRVNWPHQVSLGADCRLEHALHFKFDGIWSPGPSIVIHDRVFLGSGCEFNVRKRIELGPDCLIGSGCKFIDHDHGTVRGATPMSRQSSDAEAEISLGADVWLGVNVVVLKGVRIGRGAIVGAGAVVTQSIGEYEIWGGVPARKIGLRS